jgi:hypothetical protein
MENMSESSKQLFAIVKELCNKSLTDWLKNSLFTWQWWLGLTIAIVPWVIWIYFRDKKSTSRLLLVAFFAMIFAFFIDTVGISFNLWFFEYKILPVIQIFFPWDFTLIPIFIMVLLQIKPNKYVFAKALIFAIFSAYIAEPFFHLIKFYHLTNWRYTYSFILYLILYLTCNFLSKRKNFDPL